MARYKTIDFIAVSNESKNRRPNAFKKYLEAYSLPKRIDKQWNLIEKILDFTHQMEEIFHKYQHRNDLFLSDIFHTHMADDLRALVILSLTHQESQLNIILRHFIEIFLYSLWLDIMSNFRYILQFMLVDKEWKPYRHEQRIYWGNKYPNRSIKERLERIRLLNLERNDGRKFYKRYFRSATIIDLLLLLSLPICRTCVNSKKGQINYKRYHVPQALRVQGKEDNDANYRTDFSYTCSFCNKNKLTFGYVHGIPHIDDILEMIPSITDEAIADKVRGLRKIYDYLSANFVHYSTNFPSILYDRMPEPIDCVTASTRVWGFEGIIFCLDLFMAITNHYYKKNTSKSGKKTKSFSKPGLAS